MGRILSIAFLMGTLISTGPAIPAQDKKPNVEATLDGAWKFFADSDEYVLEIHGKKWRLRRLKHKETKEDLELGKGEVRADYSKTPKQFDLIRDGNTIGAGIFELHGDTLIICLVAGEKNRPLEFKTYLDERPKTSVTLVMKRQNVKKQ